MYQVFVLFFKGKFMSLVLNFM